MIQRARHFPLIVLLIAACSVAPSQAPPDASATTPVAAPITVGGGPTVELQLMTELYAQVLERSGYTVRREDPASDAVALLQSLRDGALDLGVSVLGDLAADGATDVETIRDSLATDGLSLLEPSSAERGLGVAMRIEDAEEAGIATISDLLALGDEVAWGLPADCAAARECAALIEGYGITLGEMTLIEVPMCSAEAAGALNDRSVDATLACTTQPEVERMNLIVLEDDRGALPNGSISPIARADWHDVAPAGVDEIIASVSGTIDTSALTSLVVQVTLEGRSVADVARVWLEDNGLI